MSTVFAHVTNQVINVQNLMLEHTVISCKVKPEVLYGPSRVC